MDQSNKFSFSFIFMGALIGAIVAGIGYFPILITIDFIFDALGIIIHLPNCNSLECVGMVYFGPICSAWLPAVGMGSLVGLVSAGIARTSKKRFGLWIGAAIGGLVAALLVATLVEIVNFSIWS